MKMFKKIAFLAACLVMMFGAMTSTVSAATAKTPKQISDYRCWASDDPRWSGMKLGNSATMTDLTMNGNGCAVISYTKLLIQSGIRTTSFTPADMVTWMRSHKGFCTEKGYRAQVNWTAVDDIDSRITYLSKESSKTKATKTNVMKYVNQGYYVILKVTLKGGGNHFVVVANSASKAAKSPRIWNSTRGVSSSKTLYESYNLNKDPYTSFKSVDRMYIFKVSKAAAKPAVTAPAPASTLKVTNAVSPSGTLAQGAAFTVGGTVASNYNIKSVTVSVKTAGGTVKCTKTVYPNAKSYNLFGVDSAMTFSKLPAGSYVYTVTAKDEKATITTTSRFAVRSSTVTISGYNCPGTLKKGSAFSVKGIVKDSRAIKNVTVSVRTTSGVIKFQASANPNAKSYDIHKLDAKLTFRQLPAGTYVYRVAVTDANGVVKNLVTKSFRVG